MDEEMKEEGDGDGDDDEYEDVYVNIVLPPNSAAFDSATNAIGTQPGETQRGTAAASNELQESIDYKNKAGVATSVNKLRVSGLSREKPLFQSKSSVLRGEWTRLVGTELVFDENGEYLATVDGHIALQHGRLVPQQVDTRTLLQRARDLALSREAEPEQPEKQE